MRPAGLFWLWAGAVWNVEFLVYGALIMSFGLSFGQAVLAIVAGNVFYILLGFASLQGPATGTTAFMVSRAPFGQNANRGVAFFNWITQVGFEIEGIVIIVLVFEAMFLRGGVTAGTGLKVRLDPGRRRHPVPHAVPRSCHDHQGAALAVVRVHRRLRGDGRPHRASRPSEQPAPERLVGRLDDGSGGHHLGRRARLDGERQRLLALPAAPPRRPGPSGRRRSAPPSPRCCSSCSAQPPSSSAARPST